MVDTCGTCRYGTNVEKLTLCKRYPPVAIPHFAGHYSFGSAGPTEDSMPGYWPAVQQDDLCGEFKVKQDQAIEQPSPPVIATTPAPTPEPKKLESKPEPEVKKPEPKLKTKKPKLIPKVAPSNKNKRYSVRDHK